MRWGDRVWAGVCLFVGATEFLTLMMVAEAIASATIPPGYSMSASAISDLGVGVTAGLFNGSIVVLGLLAGAAGYLYYRADRQRLVAIPLLLTGLGALGVGVFPESTGPPHAIFAFMAFLFGNLMAILAYRVEKPPLRFISPVLGVIGLVALVLFLSGTYLGLGLGGMERMIVYPTLVWTVAFGGSLMTTAASEPAPQPMPRDVAPGGAVPRVPVSEFHTASNRTETLERMTEALEAAKRARDAGRSVSGIRRTLKQSRAAFEAGDYETARRLADDILRELGAVQASP